jgi:hypothetical protein
MWMCGVCYLSPFFDSLFRQIKKEGALREQKYQDEGKAQYILPLGDRTAKLAIDATVMGNLSRFFNHSCDPNMNIVEIYSDHGDKRHFRIGNILFCLLRNYLSFQFALSSPSFCLIWLSLFIHV